MPRFAAAQRMINKRRHVVILRLVSSGPIREYNCHRECHLTRPLHLGEDACIDIYATSRSPCFYWGALTVQTASTTKKRPSAPHPYDYGPDDCFQDCMSAFRLDQGPRAASARRFCVKACGI